MFSLSDEDLPEVPPTLWFFLFCLDLKGMIQNRVVWESCLAEGWAGGWLGPGTSLSQTNVLSSSNTLRDTMFTRLTSNNRGNWREFEWRSGPHCQQHAQTFLTAQSHCFPASCHFSRYRCSSFPTSWAPASLISYQQTICPHCQYPSGLCEVSKEETRPLVGPHEGPRYPLQQQWLITGVLTKSRNSFSYSCRKM